MTISQSRREAILEAWHNKCAITRIQHGAFGENTLLQIDHIQPRSKGGTDDFENLIPIIAGLNRTKSDMDLDPGLYQYCKFLAASRAPKVLTIFERMNHTKITYNETDPAKIDLDKLKESLSDSVRWKARHVFFIAKAYIQKNITALKRYTSFCAKSWHQIVCKLSWLGIYSPEYMAIGVFGPK